MSKMTGFGGLFGNSINEGLSETDRFLARIAV
jgi:hypothetical protein